MTRNDIKALFPDATKEAIDQLLDINSADIGKAMNKAQTSQDQLESKIQSLTEQLTSANEQVKALTDDVGKKDKELKTLTAEKDSALNNLKAQYEVDVKALTDKHTGELNTLNEQLKAAQDRATVADTLTERVSQLTKDIADRDATIAKNTKQYLVRDALRGLHAKNVDVLLPLLNLDQITVKDDNTLEGFNEQLKPIQERDAYLFDTNAGTQRAGSGANPDVGDGSSPTSAVNQAIRQLAGIV